MAIFAQQQQSQQRLSKTNHNSIVHSQTSGGKPTHNFTSSRKKSKQLTTPFMGNSSKQKSSAPISMEEFEAQLTQGVVFNDNANNFVVEGADGTNSDDLEATKNLETNKSTVENSFNRLYYDGLQ